MHVLVAGIKIVEVYDKIIFLTGIMFQDHPCDSCNKILSIKGKK